MNFEAKVKYEKIDPVSGKNKVISETYLLDAETFGDAEVKTLKYMAAVTSSTVVATIKKSDIHEVIGDDGAPDVFYKTTIKQSVIDDLSGKEKSETIQVLVGVDNFKHSLSYVEDWILGSMFDMEIMKIAKSQIVGIF